MIFDIDNWKEIGATLSRNKTRTVLTAFGIFWGTAMLAMLMGGSQGLKQSIFGLFEGLASNSAVIFPERTTMPYKGFKKGMSWSLTQTDVENLRLMVPEIDKVSPLANFNTTFKYKDKTQTSGIIGAEPNYMDLLHPTILKGRFINDQDIAQNSKVAVIGNNAASTLFGDEDPIGKFVQADNVYYRIVGVAKQKSEIQFGERVDDALIIPLSTVRNTYNMGKNIHYMTIIFKPEYNPTELRPKIYRILRMEHPLHPDDENNMFFMDISERFKEGTQVLTGVEILILFVGLSSLIAGIIGVGNIMWIIVKERTKEFGIRRALGAKPRTVMSQIMQESAVLTLIAGTAGICFAVGVLALATKISENVSENMVMNFQLSFWAAIIIMVLFIVLGGAAGIIPALKAMKIKPIEALNDK